MGLFSSLFGSATSDAAQKARQDALNAYNAIKTPELDALQVQLQKYVNAGTLTPEAAETQLLSSNAFNAIATDPSYVGAQKQALQQLQAVATQGGLTAVDRAQLNDITNAQNQQNRSQNAATMQQAQQRGTGGSDLTAVNELINEQGAADRAANSGVSVAANAQQRALQAMQAAGNTGNALEAQTYGEAANKAQAQNAIDLYNKQALNQTNLYNTQTSNAAQGANLANAQAINNANTQTGNANAEYNAQQNQTLYNDELQKAQGIAGVDMNAANAEQATKNQETGATLGLISGAVQGGAQALGGAFGGPAGAVGAGALTGKAMASNAPTNEANLPGGGGYNPNAPTNENQFSEGGEVSDPEHPDHMAMGGHVHCYAHGGEAYHHPECMAQGGFLSGLKKGALHSDLGVPQGEKIPAKKIEKATHSDNETLRKRAQFAENAKHWQHKDEGGTVEASTDTAHIPAATPEPTKKPEQTFIEKLGNLLGSHADAANHVDENQGGEVPEKDFRGGGKVPGKAKVKGDSPANDTVDAKLSPGEIVIPRSAAHDEDEFKLFMAKFEPKKRGMALGGVMPPAVPRVNDTNPMRDTVRSPLTNSVPLAATNDANSFAHLMTQGKPKKLPKIPTPNVPAVKVPPEARALANLHQRVSRLEGGKI